MIRIVYAKLANGKAEPLDAVDLSLEVGDAIVAETEKGVALARVLAPPAQKERRFIIKAPKKVLRKAHAGGSGTIFRGTNSSKRMPSVFCLHG